jgi:hypothetical protein
MISVAPSTAVVYPFPSRGTPRRRPREGPPLAPVSVAHGWRVQQGPNPLYGLELGRVGGVGRPNPPLGRGRAKRFLCAYSRFFLLVPYLSYTTSRASRNIPRRSSGASRPTETRTRPGVTPAWSLPSSGRRLWVVVQGVDEKGAGVSQVGGLGQGDGPKEAACRLLAPQVQGQHGAEGAQVLPSPPVGGVPLQPRVAEGLHLGVALEVLRQKEGRGAHPRHPQGHGLQALEEEVGVEGRKGHAQEGKAQGTDPLGG